MIIVSYRAITSNRIRSILTTLGIIIGVASVITLVDLTRGADRLIQDQLVRLGGKSFIVKPGRRGIRLNEYMAELTAQDADALRRLPAVDFVSPLIETPGQVVWNGHVWFTVVLGASPDFVRINEWYPEIGNFFNYQDVTNASRVCVIGKSVASNVFGSRNPLGENIRINKDIFSVIGVMEPLGQTSGGRDQDDIVILPYTTFQKRILGSESIESISISVGDSEDIEAAKSQILELLRSRHGLNSGEEGAFYIRGQQAAIDRIFTISKIMTILLASVASISLVVGGIGIMNIMLVSVRERTKEIGIRMAVGAKEADILLQFLLESVMLSLSGGLSGVVVGILASVIGSIAIKWPVVISPGAVLLALFFALIVGIFFGIYPARKASKMEPIDALRFEK